MSLPTMRRKLGPELPPIWLKRFANSAHSPTMSLPGQRASQMPKLPCSSAIRDHRRGVVAHRLELAPMADQPAVGEQCFERLVRHRPHAPRLETAEHLLESRPFRIDHAVPEPGAKDPQRHLRQIAVVAQRLELGRCCAAVLSARSAPPLRDGPARLRGSGQKAVRPSVVVDEISARPPCPHQSRVARRSD